MNTNKQKIQRVTAILIWLVIWQVVAMLLNQKLLLASPFDVIKRLFTIWKEDAFLISIGNTFLHIVLGFFSGLFIGSLLGVMAGKSNTVETLLAPLMITIKSVPVASFIIIALVWITSSKLSAFIAFLMVLPVIYNNILGGIKNIDVKLLEMADVFDFNFSKRFLYIWLPTLKSHIVSGCTTALGLCWKAGIAAEVIGIPKNSIGEMLYNAKAYLNTVDLLTWTVIIVAISVAFEKLVMKLIKDGYRRLESR